jgi:hypothetical protein
MRRYIRQYSVLAALAAILLACWSALPAAAGAAAPHQHAASPVAAKIARVDNCASSHQCNANVESVSCPTARACTASGYYADGLGKGQAFVISEKGGRWGRAAEVPGTAALNTGGHAAAEAVSCPSAGTCTVSGFYEDASHHFHVYVASEIKGKWGTARQIPGSAALLRGHDAGDALLSCPSAGNCTTGGIYDVPPYSQESFLASESHGHWGLARRIRGSQSFNSSGLTPLQGLSCASAGNCAAGGSYSPAGGLTADAFVISEKNGRWGPPRQVAVPVASRGAEIADVSCPSAGNCAASGDYTDARDNLQALVVSEKNGRWGRAQAIPGVQALNVGGDARADAVSCASAGNCSVGGDYTGPVPAEGPPPVQAFVASEKNGRWGAAREVPGSGALNTGGGAEVMGISCPAAGDCAATVTYTDAGYEAAVASEVHGTWTRIRKTRGWAGVKSMGNNEIAAISCASPGNCAAGGTFLTAVGYQAFVVSDRNGTWGDVGQVRIP